MRWRGESAAGAWLPSRPRQSSPRAVSTALNTVTSVECCFAIHTSTSHTVISEPAYKLPKSLSIGRGLYRPQRLIYSLCYRVKHHYTIHARSSPHFINKETLKPQLLSSHPVTYSSNHGHNVT